MNNENEIIIKLEVLEALTKEGFAGVHKRQDTANGKLVKHDDEIMGLKKNDIQVFAKFDGYASDFMKEIKARDEKEKENKDRMDKILEKLEQKIEKNGGGFSFKDSRVIASILIGMGIWSIIPILRGVGVFEELLKLVK